MTSHRSIFLACQVLLIAAFVAGCAGPLQRSEMETKLTSVQRKAAASDVQVGVTGAQASTATASPNVSEENFKAAIETSLVKAGVFQAAKPDGAAFKLDARIIELSKPTFGFSFTVGIEIAWTLTRTADSKLIVRKSIRTEHTTGATESFSGATRVRMAVEGAVRKNIDEMIALVSSQDL